MFIFLTDKIISIFALLVLSPLIFIIGIIVYFDLGSPIIFKQKRVGLHGKVFEIYKFRTMKNSNSSVIKQSHLEQERITKFGKFLRTSHLDELPQIYNVLKGDMSIVGPRPHEINQDKEFEKKYPKYMLRRNCLPGITGLSQINGFAGPIINEEFMHCRIHYDLVYNERIGVRLYFYIIFKTFILIVSQIYSRDFKQDS